MAKMIPRGGVERVLQPPAYEGREPEKAYAYDFKDYLGIISVEIGAVGPFVAAMTDSESSAARLPIQIEAIGVFSGRTEIDAEDRDDVFDEPRPYGPHFFEQNPPAYVRLPFAEKPGVVRPDNALLDAHYRINNGSGEIALSASTRQDRSGHGLKLEGGFIELHGELNLESSPELAADIAVGGYVSPPVKLALHALADGQEGMDRAPQAQGQVSRSSVVLIERVYDAKPRSLDRAYSRY